MEDYEDYSEDYQDTFSNVERALNRIEIEEADYSESVTESELTSFDEFSDYWHKYFEKFVWKSNLYQKMLLHIALGQIFKNIKIRKGGVLLDGRISFLLIQDQGTGKNTPFMPFMDICNKIDKFLQNHPIKKSTLRCKRLDEFSDAALIGSTKQIINEEGKTRTIKVNGVFSKSESDIIVVKEAKTILSSKKGMSSVTQYINLALEPIYSKTIITKSLITGTTECESTASFLMTSYPTQEIDIEQLNSGLFRRMLVYFNRIPTPDKIDNLLKGLQNTLLNKEEMAEFSKEGITEEDIIAEYIYITYDYFAKNEDIIFNIDKGVVETFSEFVKKQAYFAIRQPSEISQIFTSIFSSYLDYMLVIASHRALMNRQEIICKEDAEYAIELFSELLSSIAEFIGWVYDNKINSYNLSMMNREYNFNTVVVKILSELNLKNRRVTRKEMVNLLQIWQKSHPEENLGGVSQDFIYKKIRGMLDSKLITEEEGYLKLASF